MTDEQFKEHFLKHLDLAVGRLKEAYSLAEALFFLQSYTSLAEAQLDDELIDVIKIEGFTDWHVDWYDKSIEFKTESCCCRAGAFSEVQLDALYDLGFRSVWYKDGHSTGKHIGLSKE